IVLRALLHRVLLRRRCARHFGRWRDNTWTGLGRRLLRLRPRAEEWIHRLPLPRLSRLFAVWRLRLLGFGPGDSERTRGWLFWLAGLNEFGLRRLWRRTWFFLHVFLRSFFLFRDLVLCWRFLDRLGLFSVRRFGCC